MKTRIDQGVIIGPCVAAGDKMTGTVSTVKARGEVERTEDVAACTDNRDENILVRTDSLGDIRFIGIPDKTLFLDAFRLYADKTANKCRRAELDTVAVGEGKGRIMVRGDAIGNLTCED